MQMKEEKLVYYDTESISARQISEKMNGITKISLNQLALDAARALIVRFPHPIECAFIDMLGSAEKYASYIHQKLPALKLVIEAKADATYPITGAASIVAKVTRDNFFENNKYGSGYPSDPKVQKYLQEEVDNVYGFNTDVRMSWETCQKIMREKCRPCVWQLERREAGE